jgi:hypothetical protein
LGGADSELISKNDTEPLITPERICLASRSIQSEHEDGPPAFAKGLLLNGEFSVGDDAIVVTQLKPRIQQRLLGPDTQFVKASHFCLCPWRSANIDQRQAPPPAQGVFEGADGILKVSALDGLPTSGQVGLKLSYIELSCAHLEDVSTGLAGNATGAEEPAKNRYVAREGGRGPRGRTPFPDLVRQAIDQDDLVRRN